MSNKQLNEGIRGAKEGVAECWGDSAQAGQGEQMSVTISMPGKNISVTSDSVDEIANILKLAGINVGGTSAEEPTVAIAVEPGGMGGEAPEAELPPMGAQTMGQEPQPEPEQAEEPEMEEATQTPTTWTDKQGNSHPATRVQGDRYGNQPEEEKEKEKEVDEAKKPDADNDGVPDWADKHPGEDDEDFNESARILALAGVTEAQSAAQKAAFKAMIDKKNGKSDDAGSDASDDAGSDASDDMANDEEKVEETAEEVSTSNSIYGQGVYEGEQESARILKLAGVNEWANSPEGKANDKGTVEAKLPSNVGKGGGNSQFGQNRANGQGENPMSPSNTANTATIDVEEAFEIAMGEYRKFVSESIASKK